MKKLIILIITFISFNSYAQDIINFKIVNTVAKTNKTIGCKMYIEEATKTLTMKSLNTNEIFKLLYKGGGVHTLQYYSNNKLEATKTVYRRRDLESVSDRQIYTSRTGEITITLSYD